MRNPRDLPALLLYAAAAVLLYGGAFGGDRVFFPVHSDEFPPWSAAVPAERLASLRATSIHGLTDKPWSFHPQFVEAGRALRRGEVPLWNPNLFCGFPQHAVQLTGLFYPPNLPLLLGDPLRWYGILAAFHAFAAASLTYAFLRRLEVGRPGAGLGGLAFGFGGWHLLRAHYPMVAAAGTWLPLLLLSIESLARGKGPRWIAAGALALALSSSAGFPQVGILTAELALAYAGWRFLAVRRDPGETSPRRFALACGGSFLLGALLAAPQILPGVEFGYLAQRSEVSVEALRVRALHLGHFLSLLVPDLFGDPVHDGAGGPPLLAALLVPPSDVAFNVFENGAYFGVLPLLAGFLGVRRRGPTAFFATAAAVFAAFSLASPLLSVGRVLLPGFRVGAPARALFGVAFCGAALAGLGLDALLRQGLPRRRTFLAVGLLAAAGWASAILSFGDAGFAGRRLFTSRPALARASALTGVDVTREEVLRRYPEDVLGAHVDRARGQAARLFLFLGGALGALLFAGKGRPAWAIGLTAADLLSYGKPLANSVPREGLFEPPALLRPLLEGRGEGRIFRVGDPYFLPPNLLAGWGLEEAGGYSPSLRPYEAFLGTIDPAAPTGGVGASSFSGPDLPRSPLFPLLGLGWLLAPLDVALRWPPEAAQVVASEGGFALARLREAPLLALVVRRARRVRDEPAVLRRLRDPDFDPRREVVLLDPDLAGEEGTGEGPGVPAPVVERSAERVVVESPEEGWLLLLDAWYPGWVARSGTGEEKEILRADLLFRAVPVSKGERIEFSFEPASFRWGVALGIAGLVGAGASLLRGRRKAP